MDEGLGRSCHRFSFWPRQKARRIRGAQPTRCGGGADGRDVEHGLAVPRRARTRTQSACARPDPKDPPILAKSAPFPKDHGVGIDAIMLQKLLSPRLFTRSFTFSLAPIVCSLSLLACGVNPAPAEAATQKPESAPQDLSPLAEAAETLTGTWRCSGDVHGPDGPAPSEVVFDVRLDQELDETWLQAAFAVSSGKYKYKFTSYRTFHPSSSRWSNVIVDNLGGHTVAWSTDGVIWTGESNGPMGEMQIKDTETVVSPGKINLLGQYSLDGKSWKTGYDLSCAK